MDDDDNFSSAMRILLNLIKVIKKKEFVSFLKAKCPSIPSTRWVYAFEVAHWIHCNADSINEGLQSDQGSIIVDHTVQDEALATEIKEGIPPVIYDLLTILHTTFISASSAE